MSKENNSNQNNANENNGDANTASQQAEENNVEGNGTATKKTEDNLFTQEDVNNVVSRETKEAQEKVFKELGIEDFENAKEGMRKFKEWQDAQKTESEKRDEKLEALEKDYLQTEKQNNFLKAQITATKQGVVPDAIEDVVTLAQNIVSDEVDMETAIEQVIEKYPHFAEKQEEKNKPHFTNGTHSTKGKTKSNPFQKVLEKYE